MPPALVTRSAHVNRRCSSGADDACRRVDLESRRRRRPFASPFDDCRAVLRDSLREPGTSRNSRASTFDQLCVDPASAPRVIERDRAVPLNSAAGHVRAEGVQRDLAVAVGTACAGRTDMHVRPGQRSAGCLEGDRWGRQSARHTRRRVQVPCGPASSLKSAHHEPISDDPRTMTSTVPGSSPNAMLPSARTAVPGREAVSSRMRSCPPSTSNAPAAAPTSMVRWPTASPTRAGVDGRRETAGLRARQLRSCAAHHNGDRRVLKRDVETSTSSDGRTKVASFDDGPRARGRLSVPSPWRRMSMRGAASESSPTSTSPISVRRPNVRPSAVGCRDGSAGASTEASSSSGALRRSVNRLYERDLARTSMPYDVRTNAATRRRTSARTGAACIAASASSTAPAAVDRDEAGSTQRRPPETMRGGRSRPL